MNDSATALEAHDAFRVTVNGVWREILAGRMTDDDGWAEIGEALAQLRGELE